MKTIRIEKVGDVNSIYPYLEVFLKESKSPFLEIAISENKELIFNLFSSNKDVHLSREDWEFILSTAKDFLPKALKDEDDFLKISGQ